MITRIPSTNKLGYEFVASKFIPEGNDEYFIRNKQSEAKQYRNLLPQEISTLIQAGNSSNNWNDVWVTEIFDTELVKGCSFFGRVRIGHLEAGLLEYHDMRLPIGLYNSMIVSCDIGDYNVINHVHFMSHYITGSENILFNIHELQVSDHAKFGYGILKQEEDESSRIWVEVCNENTGRKILAFDGMLTSDAWMWSKFRDDKQLMDRFKEMTDNSFSSQRGFYGTIGSGCVIKNCEIIKDVRIGDAAYIKGGNKLKNLTINSSFDTPTQLGEGCELVNGMIGYGCRIFYGVKAVRFVMADHSSLKYGARLINSVLGENSTISCCEVLNSLIFPGHEQHHNNSFLIAGTILGQSNMAAGATIGSNHNSRANDGEIIAGRGFWPGLSVSLKHNCMFASFTLISKGAYPAELNIPLPFALIGNSESDNALLISPAYWWQHNMYALERNAWKYQARDARKVKHQEIEFDYLAPDTVEEMFEGLRTLERWTAKFLDCSTQEATNALLSLDVPDKISLVDKNTDASGRKIIINKPAQAYASYIEMMHYFCIKTISAYANQHFDGSLLPFTDWIHAKRYSWTNIGGQLIRSVDVAKLKSEIKSKKINSWDEVHQAYKKLDDDYLRQKTAYALAVLEELYQQPIADISPETWIAHIEKAQQIAKGVAERTSSSRKKDYEHAMRKMMYDNIEEMNAVLGPFDENMFIKNNYTQIEKLVSELERIKRVVQAPILK